METRQQIDSEKQQLIDLVLAAQQGCHSAFDELFSRFQRSVYLTVIRRLGNDAEAQELCQEVFIQAMRKIGQLDNPVCFGGWLRAIAHRMAINRLVRGRSAVSLDNEGIDPEAECEAAQTPLGEILARERADQVHVGLNRLTKLDRETLVAFYFHGQSLVEMSNHFDSPVGTIKRRLHVARQRLAKELAMLAPA
jgi:RNA polymerase sigma-70 factor (ECF subfamily)